MLLLREQIDVSEQMSLRREGACVGGRRDKPVEKAVGALNELKGMTAAFVSAPWRGRAMVAGGLEGLDWAGRRGENSGMPE